MDASWKRGSLIKEEGRRYIGKHKHPLYQLPGTTTGKGYNGEEDNYMSLLSRSTSALLSAGQSNKKVQYSKIYALVGEE